MIIYIILAMTDAIIGASQDPKKLKKIEKRKKKKGLQK